ncbi:general transcription factor 3C polypeptide 3 [Acyrthosiphon pisum]|uniref:General transcription factor 3C polypeptide 3 n=1 Tax=Acyrthosiphon pisum TaxID=7029 RepID=A0A8R2B8S0_ACYPI|nr:general transcription factor 3C polypeptide 3 [Acyrthosiphon pisum]|eukprot:XP_008187131.1 PREDICTED: general transcription factor 3C polypeptide 3 [Acyrthosiphon pisum]
MAESMLNIEDMEIVFDEGTPDVFMDLSKDDNIPEDDIFDFLDVQEIETPTIETKIEVPDGTSENEELAIVYNLEGNTIQSYDSHQDINAKPVDDKINNSPSKRTKLDDKDDDTVVEGPRSRQMGKIPLALRGLIGQAKMFMLRKNYNMAIQICVNILKECPNASEPFFTLSDIYEQMGNMKKSLETAVIGNSLSSVTSEDWVLLGETCESNNMLPLTDFCLTKAIQKDRRNLDLHIKRASILEQLGTAKSAMNEYDRLLRKLRPDQKDSITTLSKLLIDNFVKNKNYERASNILIHVFNLFPDDIKPNDFVTCLDYLVKTKNFRKSLELLCEHYYVDFVADLSNETCIIEILECTAPITMPMLVRVKLIEILVQLEAFSILSPIYEPVLNMTDVNKFHLDIANILFEANQHKHAIIFLERLINSENELFDQHQHALKIKYSDCLKTLGHLEQAIDNYNKLLDVNPQQLTVKFDLYMSLKKLNRIDQSLEVLFQNDMENLDCRLLYEYVLASLDKDDMFEKCWKAANLMFSRHCLPVNSLREVKSMLAIHNVENRHDTLLTMKKELLGYQHDSVLTINPLPSAEEEWNIMCAVCLKCIEKNLYYKGLKLLLSAMNSTVLVNYNHQIVLNAIKFAYKVRAYKLGFMLSRYLLFKYPQAPQISNLFCFLLKKCSAKKQAKFIFRLAAKYPDNIALNLLDTNVFNDAYNYQLLFSRYTELLNKLDDKSQLYFMLGVIILRLCTFKVGADRHSLSLQGIGFLMKYKEHRGVEHEQECYFNIARAYHQVGMVAKSLHYYKLVLETKPFSEECCLNHAAAYNLHLIYLDSGNVDVALMYISLVQV